MDEAWRWIAGIVVTLALIMLVAFVRESRPSRYWAMGLPMIPRVTPTQSQIDANQQRGTYIQHLLTATQRR